MVGKMPSEKERLASLAIISENTDGQSLSNEVRMKSTDDDIEGMDVISLPHQQWITLEIDFNDSPK